MTRLEYLQSLDSTVVMHYEKERDVFFVKGDELGGFRPGTTGAEATDNAIAEMLKMVRTLGGTLSVTTNGVTHEVTADKLRGLQVTK